MIRPENPRFLSRARLVACNLQPENRKELSRAKSIAQIFRVLALATPKEKVRYWQSVLQECKSAGITK